MTKFVNKARSCLHDTGEAHQICSTLEDLSVASVRHCAAISLMQLNSNCLAEEFTSVMFTPVFVAAEDQAAPMCHRMAVCLIGSELVKILGSERKLADVKWSEAMFDDLMKHLSKLADDPVRNLR